jgi:predicted phosphodiesterase
MRIGIFSDVHGNLEALREVYAFYDQQNIDRYICLGDVVGYGPDPNICVNLVRERVMACVMGNHDAAVGGKMDYNYYYDAARTALDHHVAQLTPDNMRWLRELPYTVMDDYRCYSHGSPVNPQAFDYVFNLQQANSLLRHWDSLATITFIGHSHLTKTYALESTRGARGARELTGETLTLEYGTKYIATVGSVGQPRDNDSRACCTIFDTETRTLSWHRVDYAVDRTAESIFAQPNLSADFGKRLFLGI